MFVCIKRSWIVASYAEHNAVVGPVSWDGNGSLLNVAGSITFVNMSVFIK